MHAFILIRDANNSIPDIQPQSISRRFMHTDDRGRFRWLYIDNSDARSIISDVSVAVRHCHADGVTGHGYGADYNSGFRRLHIDYLEAAQTRDVSVSVGYFHSDRITGRVHRANN